MDAIVAPYHWDDRAKFAQDYLFLNRAYETVLPLLATKLNEHHGVTHSLRYWRVLVGPWLLYFTQILFDRWSMLVRVREQFDISGMHGSADGANRLVAADMIEFISLFQRDDWNLSIYTQLALDYVQIAVNGTAASRLEALPQSPPRKSCWIAHPMRTSSRILAALSGPADVVVMDSTLSHRQNLALQIRLGQIPVLRSCEQIQRAEADDAQRKWFIPSSHDLGQFERVLVSMIPRNIPTAYLEGYAALAAASDRVTWPMRPRTIIASQLLHTDEVVKLKVAQHVENGVPLTVLQHGGGYGISQHMSTEYHETTIADRFLTWGWTSPELPNQIPAVFPRAGRHTARSGSADRLLIVGVCYPRQSYKLTSEPIASQWLTYFEGQCRFLASLPEEIRNLSTVRLYPADYGWCQKERWHHRMPGVHIDDGAVPLARLFRQAKLVVATYNATVFLETLARNVPTIIFWSPQLWELRETAVPFFRRLQEVGIFHESSEAAAQQVTDIWPDIEKWWNCVEVSSARQSFCDQFARTTQDPVGDLIDALPTGQITGRQ
jgi:putative transferase (TIGR04331 family)